MSRRTVFVATATLITVLFVAAIWKAQRSREQSSDGKAALVREFTDMTGRPVHVPVRPARILSLCTAATDTLWALGTRDRLAAIDEFSRVVPGTEGIAVVGKGGSLSRERVVAMDIDLAFVWWYQDDAAARLEELAVPVVRIRSGRAAELPALIRLVGQCVDLPVAAEQQAARVEAFLAEPPRAAGNPKRVFLEMYGPLKTAGRETFTNDVLELAGARNVAADAKGAVLFSAERLVETDPDIILCVGTPADAASLAARPGMAALGAVQAGRVYPVDHYWLVAGPHLPESVAKLREVLSHPDAK